MIERPLFAQLGLAETGARELAQALFQQIPAKRFGAPEEVATAVAFLRVTTPPTSQVSNSPSAAASAWI